MKKNIHLLVILAAAVMVVLAGSMVAFAGDADNPTTFTIGSLTYQLLTNDTVSVGAANTSIETAEIPEKVTNDGKNYSVTEVADKGFKECTSLAKVTLPDTITVVGEQAFRSCEAMTEINLSDKITSIGKLAFYSCTNLTNVHMPIRAVYGDNTFGNCKSLTEVNISADATYGENVFPNIKRAIYVDDNSGSVHDLTGTVLKGNTTVESVEFKCQYEKISDEAFSGCSNLKNINLPDKVTSIGGEAFSGCSSLISMKIPDTVTSIGGSAFSGCSSLASINIPDGVTRIEAYTFSGCSSLRSIEIPEAVTHIEYATFLNCSSLMSITTPDTITSIGSVAFSGCSSLMSMKIPDTVTSIGGGAFDGCSSLTRVDIPDTITSIGSDMFSGCSSLTSINIPDTITIIGDSAFSGCNSLRRINIPDTVTSIGKSVFSGCSSLTSIKIPDTVTRIEAYTFSGCSSLRSINIPDAVTNIVTGAFSGCSSLVSIDIPDMADIGDSVFSGCSSLTSIEIPETVTRIEFHTFSGCSSLTSIKIPATVTYISPEVFNDISRFGVISYKGSRDNWESFEVSKNHYYNYQGDIHCSDGYIHNDKFNANGITFYKSSDSEVSVSDVKECATVTIPKSVSDLDGNTYSVIGIHGDAFSGEVFNTVILPNSIKSIDNSAFSKCTNLTKIYFIGTEDEWKKITKSNEVESLNVIYLSDSSVVELINNIGTVTLDSASAINEAREAYDALTEEEKEKVTNYDTLTEAETVYAKLSDDKSAADLAIKKIENIGTVTLNSSGTITAARNLYNSLTDDQKALVSNYNLLTNAENSFVELRAAYVDKKIEKIGIVTLDSKDAIKEARSSYDELTEKEKSAVNLFDELKNAEETYATLKKNRDAADIAIGKIKAIGTVTLDSKTAIEEARNSYDALTDAQKDLVTSKQYAALVKAEKTYVELKAADEQTKADQKAVAEVVRKINAIGTVTLNSQDTIEAARKAYNALSDSLKSSVDNYEVLTQAEEKYVELKAADEKRKADQKAADVVEEKIQAIGTVTLNSKKEIEQARSGYAALTDDQKELVNEKTVQALTDAESRYAELEKADEKFQADQKAADVVAEKIQAIGTVTLDSKTAIEEARNSYDALTDAQKDLVTSKQYAALVKAEKTYVELKAADEQTKADQKAVAEVVRKINAIGTVTLNSQDAIEAARKAYDTLSDSLKGSVTNYEKLKNAEVQYSKLTVKSQEIIVENSITKIFGTKTFKLNAKTNGDGKLSYVSSNRKIATVSSSGIVTIKGVGIARIIITATQTEKYKAASKTVTIKILPKGVKVAKLTGAKKSFSVKWSKQSNITGYRIQYSMSKLFKKGSKYKIIKKYNSTSAKISKLKVKKKYYIRIQTYKTIGGKKYYSNWSQVKAVKTK